MGKHNEFGKLGEEKAATFLTENGYRIIHRNYRYLKGEIDLIARKDGILAIIEVKSRTNDFLEDIAAIVHSKKINLLIQTANQFVLEHDLDVEVRFDIVTVLKKGTDFELEHLENTFYHF